MSSRILLLQPQYDTHVVSPPLGLGSLASYLRREGHRVSLLDLNLTHMPQDQFEKHLLELSPDLVGISAMSTGTVAVRELISLINSRVNTPVVVGGAEASALPEHTLRFTGADFVAVGEGEVTLAELVSTLDGAGGVQDVLSLGYLDRDEFKLNRRRELIEDLDSLPFPAWDMIPPRNYRIAPVISAAKRFPIAPILTTRGCPFSCTFCASNAIWGKTWRRRGPSLVVDEIEMLLSDYGVREIFISDDNFNLKTSHAVAFCEEILRRGLKFPWACPNGLRVDRLSPKLLGLMKRAGCHLIGLGIESGNQEILDRAKKSLDLSVVREACQEIDEAGITAVGFFVFGLPGETVETLEQTIALAKSLPLKRAWFNTLAPYPGSEVFEEYIRDRDLEELEWEHLYTVGKDIAQLSSVPPETLDRYQKKAAWSFYRRPGILLDLALSQRPATVAGFFRSRFFRDMVRR